MLLVAGLGSRLRPLTDGRPKALVEIEGRSLLERAIDVLVRHGVERVVLATGYQEQALRAALVDRRCDYVFVHNPRYDSTQNAASLALCAEAIGGESCFKLDGDVLFRAEVLERLDARATPLAVAVDCGRRLDAEAMKVRCEDGRRITAFGKELPVERSAGESIGIERLDAAALPALFEALRRPEAAQRYYEDVYSDLLQAGRLEAELVDVQDLSWAEVDDLEDLEFAAGLVRSGQLAPPRPL